MPRDSFRASAKGNNPLEVLSLIFVVRNLAAIPIKVSLAWPPTSRIAFGDDPMHAVGRKESVINALAQAVFINRISEILVGVTVVVAKRCCRHAKLKGGLEVI